MRVLNVTNLPIYLPFDRAPVPFGDPLSDLIATAAAPGAFTAPGYNPVIGDAVAISFVAGGSIAAPLVVGTTYYVVATPGAGAFNLSATKGGGAITTTTTGASMTLHLISNEVDGVSLAFKPNNTVVAVNQSGGTLVLQGAADTGGVSGNPQGPGTWNTIVSLLTASMGKADLAYDWIRVSTAGTVSLLQN